MRVATAPRHLLRILLLALVPALILALAACTETSTPPTPTGPPALDGVWRPSGGADALGISGAELTFLAFRGSTGVSGDGTVYARASADIPVCGAMIYAAVADDTVAIYASDVFGYLGEVQLFLYERPSDDTLALTDEDGNRQTFDRVAAVPAADECVAAVTSEVATGIEVDLASFANLLSDGSTLRVVDDDGAVYQVNLGPATLTPLGDFGFTSFDQAITMQGGSYWAHCGCGGSQDIERRQLGVPAALDEFDTATDLGNEIGIRAGAWDGASLWLAGYSYDANTYRLLKIDSDAEPDVLLTAIDLDVSLQAMTSLGGDLWAVVQVFGPQLVRIDPITGGVDEVRALPDPGGFGSYRGVASLGGDLYLLADLQDGTIAISRVTP